MATDADRACCPAKVERMVQRCFVVMADEDPTPSELLSVVFTLTRRIVSGVLARAGAQEQQIRLVIGGATEALWNLAKPKELRH
jgi:hypothetical protein